jgi:hypothetical protein
MTRWLALASSAFLVLTACTTGPPPTTDVRTSRPPGRGEGRILLQEELGVPLLLSPADGKQVVLDSEVIALELSADGSSLLASAEPWRVGGGNDSVLLTIDPETGARSVIVHAGSKESVFPAALSPDGKQVAYRLTTFSVKASRAYAQHVEAETLCVRHISSGKTACFPELKRTYSFDWSADGDRLVVGGPGSQPIWTLDPRTRRARVLLPPGGTPSVQDALARRGLGRATQFVGPVWSPSGRYLAANAQLSGGTALYVAVVVDTDGRFVALGKPSGEFSEAFDWSPAEDLLAYARGEPPYRITEARVLNAASGTERRLLETGGEKYPLIIGLAWSPDGQQVAVLRVKYHADYRLEIIAVTGEEAIRRILVADEVRLVDWAP